MEKLLPAGFIYLSPCLSQPSRAGTSCCGCSSAKGRVAPPGTFLTGDVTFLTCHFPLGAECRGLGKPWEAQDGGIVPGCPWQVGDIRVLHPFPDRLRWILLPVSQGNKLGQHTVDVQKCQS